MNELKLDALTIVTTLLVVATALSTVGTFLMVRWMATDVRHKMKGHLALGVLLALEDSWDRTVFEQTIVNTSLCYVTLASAVLRWWPQLAPGESRMTPSDLTLPLHIAPGESAKVRFAIGASKSIAGSYLFARPTDLVTGRVTYRFSGTDGAIALQSYNLPRADVAEGLTAKAAGVAALPAQVKVSSASSGLS